MNIIIFLLKYIFYFLETLNPAPMLTSLYSERKRVFIRLKLLINIFPSEPVELLAGLALFAWGISILLHFGSTGEISGIIQSVLPLWVVGIVSIYIGFIQVYALLTVNDAAKRLGSLLAFLLWVFICTTIFITTLPLSAVLFVAMTVANIWIFYRAGRPTTTEELRNRSRRSK